MSRGKRDRSTVVPARAPARRAVWNWGGEVDWDVIFAVWVEVIRGTFGRFGRRVCRYREGSEGGLVSRSVDVAKLGRIGPVVMVGVRAQWMDG